MNTEKQTGSPKKPDGTTDWDIVFDDPDVGLIALIGRVTSTDALQACGLLMIRRLFTRKNDELDVARFTNELNETISYAGAVGDIEAIKAEVIVMLRRIKDIRVAKARVYLEEKTKKNVANRRSSGSTAANTYKLVNSSRLTLVALVAGLLMATGVIGSAYWYLVASAPEDLVSDREKQAVVEHAERAREREKQRAADGLKTQKASETKKQEAQIALEKKQQAERIMPPAIVFPGVYVHQKTAGQNKNTRPIMPIFVLENKKQLSQLCETRPKIIDIINISLNRTLAPGAKADAANYVRIAESVRLQVNTALRSELVMKVLLVSDGKLSDMGTAGDRCTFASERYFDYIYPQHSK